MKLGLILLALVLPSLSLAAVPPATPSKWQEGTSYFPIVPAQPTDVPPGKVEVAEVFSYACPWCAAFDPFVQQMRKSLPGNAQMVFLPASFIPAEGWPMFQRATCTAQVLGIFDNTHARMFDAVWKTGELQVADPKTHRVRDPLPTIEDAARFYNHISQVPVDKFLQTAKSFAVDSMMRRDDAQILAYHIEGTPSIVVAGKYRITLQSAGGEPQMLELVKYLVAKETH